ncbi:MAG: transposase [bacterium]|nr:transposase [bacterium]
MIRTYQYRCYPTDEQQTSLNAILEMARWLYNRALDYRRKRWNESRYNVTYNEQAAMWRDWRNEQPEDNPLRLLNMSAGQQVLRRLDKAYREFLKGKRGKPRFKGHRFFNTVNYKPGDGASVREDGSLYLQNVGEISIKWHRPPPEGKLKNIILTRKPSGWYVAFQVECADVEIEPSENPAVGIDVGIHHALALSDGEIVDSPHYLKQSLKRLKRLQRKVARRKKGSKRREKAIAQLAKEHEHIANQRRDWWHKVTFWLVTTYGLIALEQLQLAFMLRNTNLARAAHDVSLGMFCDLLDYKAFQAGVQLVKVNPYNTSQRCSQCGNVAEKALSVRVHDCPHCGFTADRDVNAALNILLLAVTSDGTHRSGANVDPSVKRSLRSAPL